MASLLFQVSYYKTYKGIKEEGTFLECERLRIAGEMKNLVKNKVTYLALYRVYTLKQCST